MLRRLALAMMLAAGFGCAGGCAQDMAPGSLDERLAMAVQRAGETRRPLALKEPTDFAWDKVYVFAPYTPPEAIRKDLGFAWAEAGRTGIDSRDDVTLLVFVKNQRVVRSLAFPRNRGDWAMIENHAGFTPAQAVFKVTAEDASPAWWVVSETKPSR
jgi:hypothetical protein